MYCFIYSSVKLLLLLSPAVQVTAWHSACLTRLIFKVRFRRPEIDLRGARRCGRPGGPGPCIWRLLVTGLAVISSEKQRFRSSGQLRALLIVSACVPSAAAAMPSPHALEGL